jgi:hypothetical protein
LANEVQVNSSRSFSSSHYSMLPRLWYVYAMVPTLVFWERQFWKMKSRSIVSGHLVAPTTVCCLAYGMSMVPTLVFWECQFWQMKSRPKEPVSYHSCYIVCYLLYVMSMVPTLGFLERQFWQRRSRPAGAAQLAAPLLASSKSLRYF